MSRGGAPRGSRRAAGARYPRLYRHLCLYLALSLGLSVAFGACRSATPAPNALAATPGGAQQSRAQKDAGSASPGAGSAFQQAREEEEGEEQASADEASTPVKVAEREWQLVLERNVIDAESITFVVTNTGTMPHSLGLRQNGSPVAFIPDLENIQPGETRSLTAVLRPGSFELVDPGTYTVNGRAVTGKDLGLWASFTVV